MGSDKTEGERETGPQSGPGLEVLSERRLKACSFSSSGSTLVCKGCHGGGLQQRLQRPESAARRERCKRRGEDAFLVERMPLLCNGRVTRMQLRVRRSVVLWRGRGRGQGCWWCLCGGGGGGGGGDAGGGGGGGACVEVVVEEEVEGVLVDFIVELA